MYPLSSSRGTTFRHASRRESTGLELEGCMPMPSEIAISTGLTSSSTLLRPAGFIAFLANITGAADNPTRQLADGRTRVAHRCRPAEGDLVAQEPLEAVEGVEDDIEGEWDDMEAR